jgi:hypothetical protein
MATKNLVSASLTAANISSIKTAMQTISDKMPFLISLTDAQRRGGLKLGDKTFGFVDKVMDYSKTNSDMVPAYLDLTELTTDYQLFKDLSEILRILKPLEQSIEDTATEAGIEALAASLVFYGSVKAATKQGVQGAKAIYEDLQKRFPGASGSAGTTTETTKTT